MGLQLLAREETRRPSRKRYAAPPSATTTLTEALAYVGRPPLDESQLSFIASNQSKSDTFIHYAGSLDLLCRPAVAVVGARAVTDEGAARARRLAKELARAGVTVVSGLAKGVDVNAHQAAIAAGGKTVAVIGTPLGKAYPAEHGNLQTLIAQEHLLISPFEEGSRVFPSNFPKRNRVMAALTDGTVIIEASDTSGTLHQAAECQRLGRWLFILRSVYEDPALSWPKTFVQYKRTRIVSSAGDVLEVIR